MHVWLWWHCVQALWDDIPEIAHRTQNSRVENKIHKLQRNAPIPVFPGQLKFCFNDSLLLDTLRSFWNSTSPAALVTRCSRLSSEWKWLSACQDSYNIFSLQCCTCDWRIGLPAGTIICMIYVLCYNSLRQFLWSIPIEIAHRTSVCSRFYEYVTFLVKLLNWSVDQVSIWVFEESNVWILLFVML